MEIVRDGDDGFGAIAIIALVIVGADNARLRSRLRANRVDNETRR
jgi:hypothetical protein